ncbi:MAG: methyltransferase domain-containing protein [Bacteroidota bacterium]
MLASLPSITTNLATDRCLERFFEEIERREHPARVLIIGSGEIGKGLDKYLASGHIEFIETDVVSSSRLSVICDGHDLPFMDASIDGVIIQAVLEHVLLPHRCVEEIHRVLKPNGVVYAETPFMQQVHEGRYDFTRFTHLGHRNLFANFSEIDSGLANGPGSAMAWSYQYLLLSFARRRATRGIARAVARLTGFWLKYLDYIVARNGGALDAACGVYFLGTKSERSITSEELLAGYKGGQTSAL